MRTMNTMLNKGGGKEPYEVVFGQTFHHPLFTQLIPTGELKNLSKKATVENRLQVLGTDFREKMIAMGEINDGKKKAASRNFSDELEAMATLKNGNVTMEHVAVGSPPATATKCHPCTPSGEYEPAVFDSPMPCANLFGHKTAVTHANATPLAKGATKAPPSSLEDISSNDDDSLPPPSGLKTRKKPTSIGLLETSGASEG